MKNITLSAEEEVIERARRRATDQKTTLNVEFRRWLERYAGSTATVEEYRQIMKRLKTVDAGRKFSREELNSR
jgi:hypothetical protein